MDILDKYLKGCSGKREKQPSVEPVYNRKVVTSLGELKKEIADLVKVLAVKQDVGCSRDVSPVHVHVPSPTPVSFPPPRTTTRVHSRDWSPPPPLNARPSPTSPVFVFTAPNFSPIKAAVSPPLPCGRISPFRDISPIRQRQHDTHHRDHLLSLLSQTEKRVTSTVEIPAVPMSSYETSVQSSQTRVAVPTKPSLKESIDMDKMSKASSLEDRIAEQIVKQSRRASVITTYTVESASPRGVTSVASGADVSHNDVGTSPILALSRAQSTSPITTPIDSPSVSPLVAPAPAPAPAPIPLPVQRTVATSPQPVQHDVSTSPLRDMRGYPAIEHSDSPVSTPRRTPPPSPSPVTTPRCDTTPVRPVRSTHTRGTSIESCALFPARAEPARSSPPRRHFTSPTKESKPSPERLTRSTGTSISPNRANPAERKHSTSSQATLKGSRAFVREPSVSPIYSTRDGARGNSISQKKAKEKEKEREREKEREKEKAREREKAREKEKAREREKAREKEKEKEREKERRKPSYSPLNVWPERARDRGTTLPRRVGGRKSETGGEETGSTRIARRSTSPQLRSGDVSKLSAHSVSPARSSSTSPASQGWNSSTRLDGGKSEERKVNVSREKQVEREPKQVHREPQQVSQRVRTRSAPPKPSKPVPEKQKVQHIRKPVMERTERKPDIPHFKKRSKSTPVPAFPEDEIGSLPVSSSFMTTFPQRPLSMKTSLRGHIKANLAASEGLVPSRRSSVSGRSKVTESSYMQTNSRFGGSEVHARSLSPPVSRATNEQEAVGLKWDLLKRASILTQNVFTKNASNFESEGTCSEPTVLGGCPYATHPALLFAHLKDPQAMYKHMTKRRDKGKILTLDEYRALAPLDAPNFVVWHGAALDSIACMQEEAVSGKWGERKWDFFAFMKAVRERLRIVRKAQARTMQGSTHFRTATGRKYYI